MEYVICIMDNALISLEGNKAKINLTSMGQTDI